MNDFFIKIFLGKFKEELMFKRKVTVNSLTEILDI